jgi:hypothetical protein
MQVFVENHIPRGSADGVLLLVNSEGNLIATFDDDITEETAEYIAACVNRCDSNDHQARPYRDNQTGTHEREASLMQTVYVFIEGGVIHDMRVPTGITVIVRDFDVEGVEPERVQQDADGQEFVESVWEADK